MFLIAMVDIFLILYLTMISQMPSTSILTVDDFFQLKSTHESLQQKQQKTAEEKSFLLARLTEEKKQGKKARESLLASDTELARARQDLKIKENVLKKKEQSLSDLSREIDRKKSAWKEIEGRYQEELEKQKELSETSQARAEKILLEARNARLLTKQMREEAAQAYKLAKQAKADQESAINLKKKMLEEKERAIQQARKSAKARQEAEQAAKKLATNIENITQEGGVAYQRHIRPEMAKIEVSFERKVDQRIAVYRRKLTLLPLQIDNLVFVVLPSQHIGFRRGSSNPPKRLSIRHRGEELIHYRINPKNNLVALELTGYAGKTFLPHPANMEISEFMPVLLALRNQGGRSLGDRIRGLSEEYFIVNRDYIRQNESGTLTYDLEGFRGTSTRGERIIRGDQLVDLNGRLVGVAKDANQIIRIDTLSGWEEQTL